VSERERPTRREFLRATLAAGAAGTLACGGRDDDVDPDVMAAALAGLLDPTDDIRRLGVEYLHRHPGERRAELVAGLAARVDARRRSGAPGELARGVRLAITYDFENDDILRFGGWRLARSELRLFALVELAARDAEGSTADGLFPPEALGGRSVRWTGPLATFDLPAAAVPAGLEVRSPAPFDQQLAVALDGQAIDRLALTGDEWHALPLDRPGRVTLATTPAWHPREDFRTLGVQLATPAPRA